MKAGREWTCGAYTLLALSSQGQSRQQTKTDRFSVAIETRYRLEG